MSITATSGRRKATKEHLPENGPFSTKPYPRDDIVKALTGIAAQITH
ncbi:MAG: hypothetical protein INR62_12150 [Rhodospirillales bacterium]|nr:hypothetical protein [Acetobacter sp.]